MFPKTGFCIVFAILAGIAQGFSYFGSESTVKSVLLDSGMSFGGISINSDIHAISKRDAFEELRKISKLSIGGDSSGSSTELPVVVNRRLYNSSVALTVPLFSFKFPHLENGGFIANQAIYGVFAFAITAITFGLSFLFTGSPTSESASRSLRRLENAKNSSFNFMGSDLSHSLGMDGLQCLQKVICQANRSPENRKYGLLASAIQLAFPPPSNSTMSLRSDSSAFQTAARDGRYSKEYCEELYDCLLEPMDSARYLAHWYGHHHNVPYLLKMIDYYNNNNGTSL